MGTIQSASSAKKLIALDIIVLKANIAGYCTKSASFAEMSGSTALSIVKRQCCGLRIVSNWMPTRADMGESENCLDSSSICIAVSQNWTELVVNALANKLIELKKCLGTVFTKRIISL